MISSIKNKLSSNTGLLLRFDDIAPNMNWDYMEKCENILDSYNIKPLLGVIPNNKDKELLSYKKIENFWDKVRSWKNKGWEISMHGYTHVYDKVTYKKDYFGHGGGSEFFGHNYETQKTKIEKGLKKFNEEKIKIRSFFAPNHTYDSNTLKILKECGVKNILDGYGLMPYSKGGLNFIPQLFYKEIMLPFGIQQTQVHLNYWKEIDFKNFKLFIDKNKKKAITFDQALGKINDGFFYKTIRFSSEKSLKILRSIKN